MIRCCSLVLIQNNTATAHLLQFGFLQNVTFDDRVPVSANTAVLWDVTP
jgi:hypothetical protein